VYIDKASSNNPAPVAIPAISGASFI